jgi:tetratricopeptide (TPR) repeat protein
VTTPLIGREPERAAVDHALRQAEHGRGASLLIEGGPGSGRTTLLDHAAAEATAAGLEVLRARGSVLEAIHALGLVRQLLARRVLGTSAAERAALTAGLAGPALRALDPAADPDGLAGADEFALAQAITWLCWDLADRRPLLIAVDDLHLADPPSLRIVAFLLARVRGVPAAVLATARSDASSDLLDDLRVTGDRLVLGDLDPSEVDLALACSAPDLPVDERGRWVAATGGWPPAVAEIVARAASGTLAGSPPEIGSGEVGSGLPGVGAHVRRALAGLSEVARRVAWALAVLGTGATDVRIGSLAELEPDGRGRALAELGRAGLLADQVPGPAGAALRFRSSLVEAEISATLDPADRERLHRRAAEVITREPGGHTEAASHLHRVAPAGAPDVVAALVRAASDARSTGAPDVAVRHLRRALAEPPPDEELVTVLEQLAAAEEATGAPEAVDRYREALDRTEDPGARRRLRLRLARALAATGDTRRALAELDRLEPAAGSDDHLAEDLAIAAIARNTNDTFPLAVERLGHHRCKPPPGDTRVERDLLAELAYHEALAGVPAQHGAELAIRALGDRDLRFLHHLSLTGRHIALLVLFWAEELDLVEQACELVLDRGRSTGRSDVLVLGNDLLGAVRQQRGDLPAAAAAADAARRVAGYHGTHPMLVGAHARLARTLLAMGDVDSAADALVLPGGEERWAAATTFHLHLLAQAEVAAAQW